jgi:predicted Na+-dependent transporter
MKLDKRTLIRWKIYVDRARMYASYIQFFMLIVVFINTLGDNTYGKYLVRYSFISIPVLLVVFIGLSLVLGYIDSRLGIRREEQRNISTSNPVQMEILQILRELEKRGQRPE